MNPATLAAASRELSGRLYSLVDSLSALRELAALDVRDVPEEPLVKDALDVLLRHQDAQSGATYLLRDGQLAPSAFCLAEPTDPRAGAPGPLMRALSEDAARGGQLVCIEDCAAEAARRGLARTSHQDPGGSMISAPVSGRGKVLGAVTLFHPRPGHFGAWHGRAVELFCGMFGHILEHARLLRDMEQTISRRTEQLASALSEAEHLKIRYEQLSHVDELTGLHNRRFFFPESEAAIARAERYEDPLSLLLLDVDHFKRVNDRFGHAAGDLVLKSVARALTAETRDCDIVSRFGGEEFAMVLPNTPLDGALMVAQRIRAAVAQMRWNVEAGTVAICVSIGATTIPGDRRGEAKASLATLLREADHALYDCKTRGRNRVLAYREHRTDESALGVCVGARESA